MKVVLFLFALLAIAMANTDQDDPCQGRKDGYFCDTLWTYVLCENEQISGAKVECDNTKICVEGTSSYFVGTTNFTAYTPVCQDAMCDSLGDDGSDTGAIVSALAPTIMEWCYDVAYERDTYYNAHKTAFDLMFGTDKGEFPINVEYDSRRDPEDHDHFLPSAPCDMPDWCKDCCGGAKRQEEYLVGKYNITADDEYCNIRTHVMACSKKFPPCEWADDEDYAKDVCLSWREQCLKVDDRLNFDCAKWLSSGFSVIPSIALALAALLF
jgi:hypothetical protein